MKSEVNNSFWYVKSRTAVWHWLTAWTALALSKSLKVWNSEVNSKKKKKKSFLFELIQNLFITNRVEHSFDLSWRTRNLVRRRLNRVRRSQTIQCECFLSCAQHKLVDHLPFGINEVDSQVFHIRSEALCSGQQKGKFKLGRII